MLTFWLLQLGSDRGEVLNCNTKTAKRARKKKKKEKCTVKMEEERGASRPLLRPQQLGALYVK